MSRKYCIVCPLDYNGWTVQKSGSRGYCSFRGTEGLTNTLASYSVASLHTVGISKLWIIAWMLCNRAPHTFLSSIFKRFFEPIEQTTIHWHLKHSEFNQFFVWCSFRSSHKSAAPVQTADSFKGVKDVLQHVQTQNTQLINTIEVRYKLWLNITFRWNLQIPIFKNFIHYRIYQVPGNTSTVWIKRCYFWRLPLMQLWHV